MALNRWQSRFAVVPMIVALVIGALGPAGEAAASAGGALLQMDGGSATYTDRAGVRSVLGTPRYSSSGRSFGARIVRSLSIDSSLATSAYPAGRFPYGVYGMDETDVDGDGVYESGDVDPISLLSAVESDGVYSVGLSTKLGRIGSQDKIIRTLDGAKSRNIKLIVRVISYSASNGVYTLNASATQANLDRMKQVFAKRPDLKSTVYAWYSWDEPMQKHVSLSALRQTYQMHKKTFPDMKVFTVFNQNQNIDGGLLGQYKNPYGADVADIVGLNVYPAISNTTNPFYGYGVISKLYPAARRYVNSTSAGQWSPAGSSTRIFAVAQAHALDGDPANLPEPHQMYRQANDWFRAGPDAGLRGIDGLLWYSWHFPPGTKAGSDLEGRPENRQMAREIGLRIMSRAMATHKLPYRSELYLPYGSAPTIRIPTSGHIYLGSGSILLSISHLWVGSDSTRRVLLDTGASTSRNRMIIEKSADNVLRFRVFDGSGVEKWVGMRVDKRNMPGTSTMPGYSDIGATWSNGALNLYLDGAAGTLRGGAGTGKRGSAGSYMYIGTDMGGRYGAYSTFGYLSVWSGQASQAEVRARQGLGLAAATPAAPGLASPAAGAATSDTTPTFQWYAASTGVKYQIQLSTASNFSTISRTATVTGTAYTASALSGGRTYYWRVRAGDNYGWGGWSSVRALKVS